MVPYYHASPVDLHKSSNSEPDDDVRSRELNTIYHSSPEVEDEPIQNARVACSFPDHPSTQRPPPSTAKRVTKGLLKKTGRSPIPQSKKKGTFVKERNIKLLAIIEPKVRLDARFITRRLGFSTMVDNSNNKI
ncbi:hypothetical protein CDL12_00574 [Handroanthus impetiginosus]|uniref:Uncharacterized protein n=1 Tax=Handroanthus impetiginosus TaxID=429701 RepID=A0A2G9IA84_9LAMI|nr:hypothetical protein CDL12_00574 [Handroanthus impetiginosus]